MDQVWTPVELAERLGVSVATLAQMRYRGAGPKFVKLNARTVRYRESDIAVWLESLTRSATSG